MSNKSELEKALSNGIYGTSELKHDEKIHYLGEFRERIIRLLTKKQVTDFTIYPEIIEAIKEKRATKLIIRGDIEARFSKKYEKLAREMGKNYTVVNNREFKGDAGLIVVSSHGVDVEEIHVVDRDVRLEKLGLTKNIIHATGKKVCSNCLDQIIHADPSEATNYEELTLIDRLWGGHCEACGKE